MTRNLFNDRFSVAVGLALAIHAAVLLGIGFVYDINPLQKAAETLDVVLVNWRTESEPDEAEYLAQVSQVGGGDAEEAEKPSQEISPDVPSVDQGEMPVSSEEIIPEMAPESRQTVTTESLDAPPTQQVTDVEQPLPALPSAAELMQQSMQVAQMQPENDRESQWQSKLPRRRFISANTREYEFATYMAAWVAKVERVGNLNYPTELRQRGVAGDLLMTVGIDAQGGVESISIQRGSGIPELDRAAERIVRLAAPYSPLPPDIAAKVDVLHITRTWRFSAGHRFE